MKVAIHSKLSVRLLARVNRATLSRKFSAALVPNRLARPLNLIECTPANQVMVCRSPRLDSKVFHMNKFLIASALALGLTFATSDLSTANAQFGYGYAPIRTVAPSSYYCPSQRPAYSVGYGGYGYQRAYASPGLSLSVSRSVYSSPYYRSRAVSSYHPYGYYSSGYRSVGPGITYGLARPPITAVPGVQLRLGF